MFLNLSVPKLLLLAGVDRLDKELCVGQMQGKFQIQILSKSGHAGTRFFSIPITFMFV
jgi:protein phosphatase methylesterase 1